MNSERTGFSLQITERCNLKCRYCYVLRREKRYPDCSSGLCERFVDFVLRESGETAKITFFGGEPLLRPDLIRHTVRYGAEAATRLGKLLSFHVITNGTLLDDEIGDYLAANRIGLEISIDGPGSIHDRNRPFKDGSGSFFKVYSTLCRFVDRYPGHPVSIFSVVTSREALPWLHALCRGIDAERFTANPCRMPYDPKGRKNPEVLSSEELLVQQLELYRDAFMRGDASIDKEVSQAILCWLGEAPAPECGAGINATIATRTGEIFPCPLFVGFPDMVIGDIETGFYPDKVKPFLERKSEVGCSGCRARSVCGCGCAYDSYEQTGRIGEPAPALCRTARNYAGRLEKTVIMLASRKPEELLREMDLLPGSNRCVGLPHRSSPHSYVVRLTDRCNLACDYCYENGRERGNSSMNRATAGTVADYILGGGSSRPQVCLFGGEPLLNWETGRFLIEEVARRGRAAGKKPYFHITTNGTLITREISREIARYDVTVQISIDGTKEYHDRHRKLRDGGGSFDRIARSIDFLKAENPWARIDAQVVLTPGNTDMVQIADDLTGMGFRRISFLVCVDSAEKGVSWSDADIGQLARRREEFFPYFLESVCRGDPGIDIGLASLVAAEPDGPGGLCECGAGEMFIDTGGSVYLCPQLYAAGAGPIGHCESGAVRHAASEHGDDSGHCRQCWAFERCRGGCMVHCRRCPWMNSRDEGNEAEEWCDLMRSQFARAIVAHRLLRERYPDSLRKLQSMFAE